METECENCKKKALKVCLLVLMPMVAGGALKDRDKDAVTTRKLICEECAMRVCDTLGKIGECFTTFEDYLKKIKKEQSTARHLMNTGIERT